MKKKHASKIFVMQPTDGRSTDIMELIDLDIFFQGWYFDMTIMPIQKK